MKDTIIYYGFDNIGTYQTNARYTGHKEYEIKDHLGNVRVVISDVKNAESMVSAISSWTFTAEIRNLNSYFPYGMELPGGAYASIGNYGYGYNGMEKDDELKGSGKTYTTKFRQASTVEGNWWSRDPKEMNYPSFSPYSLMNNNPIRYIDPLGLEGAEYRFRQYMKSKGGVRKEAEEYADRMHAEIGKQVLRYVTPVEDIYGVITGNDFDNEDYNRAEAGVWTILSFVPGAKAFKPVIKVVKGSSRFAGKVMKFANNKKFRKHWKDHGHEFGKLFKTKEDYLEGAIDFFNKESSDIIEYVRPHSKEIVRYDRAKNIFGVAGEDGTIKTFFKPEPDAAKGIKSGLDYFRKQVIEDLGEEALQQLEKTVTNVN